MFADAIEKFKNGDIAGGINGIKDAFDKVCAAFELGRSPNLSLRLTRLLCSARGV